MFVDEARPWFLGSSSDLWQKESEVAGWQSHNCGVWWWRWKQRDPTIWHAIRTGVFHRNKDGGRRMKGQGGPFQLGKAGAYGETDLAVALLGFASSPGNQAALKTARATPRSECTTGAPPHLWVDADLEVV